MKKHVFLTSVLALSFAVVGCQSTSDYSDKSADIQNLEQQKSQIVSNQEDVLVPKQYKEFSASLDKAKDLNTRRKDASKEVAEAQGYLQVIQDKSKPTKAVLADAMSARRKALDAGAGDHPTFKQIDKDLTSATEDAADGDIKAIEKERTEFQNRYANAEADAIVLKTLGTDQKQFLQLKTRNAESVAPETFRRTESKIADAERTIRADRYNPQTLITARTVTNGEVSRLDKIATDAKRLKSESAAIELYDKDQAALALKRQMEGQKAEMANQSAAMANQNEALASQNTQLQTELSTAQVGQSQTASKLSDAEGALTEAQAAAAKKQAFEQKFADAKKMFNSNEADVFKDGDNLLIRLKGLNFEKGKGALPASSQALLKKLGTVVSSFSGARVRIEGHTDSTGSLATNAKLSEQRAGMVKDYLVSKSILANDEVVAQGLGEDGPVASNSTAAGRAQNRRVDVIVQPTY